MSCCGSSEGTEKINPALIMNDPLAPATHKFKVTIIGNSAVGKTTLLQTYLDKLGPSSPTTGAAYYEKTTQYGNQEIKFQFWDTAGQERFNSVIPTYIRDSKAVILAFAINSKESYDRKDHWLGFTKNLTDAVIVLVGTKSDLEDQRQVSADDATIWSNNRRMKYVEVSSFTNVNIDRLFEMIIVDVCGIIPQ